MRALSHLRSHLSVLAAVLAIALVAAACGGDDAEEVEEDPEGALQAAVEALADWEGIEVELRLEADDAARASLLAEEDLAAEDLDLLLDSSLTVRIADTGDPETASFELAAVVAGRDVFDLRATADERVFLRIDVQELSDVSEDAEALTPEDIEELVEAARFFGLGDAAQALAEGGWIELIGVNDLVAMLDEGADDPDVDEQQAQAAAERTAARTSRFVDEDVEVTPFGGDDVGERVRLTTNGAALTRFLEDVVDELDTGGLLEETGGQDAAEDLADIPDDAVISLDAWIDGGELRQLGIDLAALEEADELEGELYLLIGFTEFTGSIEAPDDATTLDLMNAFGVFLGGFGDLGGGFDDGFDDGFEDDGFDDGFEDDGFEDDGFDDGFEDDGVEDDGFDDGFEDEEFDGAPACISDEELAEIEQFLGEEGLAEIEQLIEQGFLERC